MKGAAADVEKCMSWVGLSLLPFFRRLIYEVCHLLLLLQNDSDSDGYSEIVWPD